MRKTAAAFLAACLLLPAHASAAQTQYDIQTKIENAFSWLETNAQPMSSAGSSASDYSIMALSRMNKDYRYASYVSATSSLTPSTIQDAQRLIMANSACGEILSDPFVGMFTYNAELSSAADTAGAVITLKSGGYDTDNGDDTVDLAGRLLTMQQSNGSFENDVLSTAKSIIALSYYRGAEFTMQGSADNETYTYDTDSAIDNAAAYLSSVQGADGGFSTVFNTAYVIMALDSTGTDAQSSDLFVKNGSDPIAYISSRFSEDGSIGESPDDTAIAVCALVSHLRAMQGKAAFFDFISQDTVNTILSGDSAGSDHLTESSGTAAETATEPPKQSILITQPPMREPEHSAFNEEEYGPQQFVGPVRETDRPDNSPSVTTDSSDSGSGGTAAIVITAIAAAAVIAAIVLLKTRPELLDMIRKKAEKLSAGKTGASEQKSGNSRQENDLISEIDKPHEVVPTEELYDPDFIKKLIPVDEIDMSVGSLLPEDDTENTDDASGSGSENK